MKAVPYCIYPIVTLLIVLLFCLGVMPKLGGMKKAYQRVAETGKVYSDDSRKYNHEERKGFDEVVKEIPFFASDLDIHLVWANSKMLEKLGISKETVFEKTNGKPEMVEVDEDGEPTGLLRDEMAMAVIIEEKPPVTTETIKKMFDVWTQYGVTAVNDMDFYTVDSEIFLKTKELEEQGELNVRLSWEFH